MDPFLNLKKTGLRIEQGGSFLEVSGSFKDIEDTFLKLRETSKGRQKGHNGAPKERSSVYEHSSAMKSASKAPVEPVEVDSVILSYFKEKCPSELNKIRRPDVSIKVNKNQVTFCPKDPSHETISARLARERFVTSYQKIATELQTRSYYFGANQLQPLLAKFPELLYSTGPRKDEITLTGRFSSIEKFEQFMTNSTKRSPSRQIDHTVDMRAPASSRALHIKPSDKEEKCSICLEQMVMSQTKTLEKCKHSFCIECLQKAFEIKPVCPTCGVIYGALKGTQPEGGRMTVSYNKCSLPGYENYGTIIIHYIIPDGLQGVSNESN